MEKIAYLLVACVFLYVAFGLLTSLLIKSSLSRHRCDCSNARKIAWKVPFNPAWIFALSEEFHIKYFGKCELCGKEHEASLNHNGKTFSSVLKNQS